MSKKETTIKIGDTVIVKNKVVSYGLLETTLNIHLVNGRIIHSYYNTEDDARRNFDEFNKKMLEYLEYED